MGFLSARYNITDWLHITGRANIDKTADQLEGIAYNGTLGNTVVALMEQLILMSFKNGLMQY
ncbi:MAG: hypothetical protein IPI77_23565 [Saprospiraceae bacterium]|nr:hypothetical protein [Saprospiraceae bacterium]